MTKPKKKAPAKKKGGAKPPRAKLPVGRPPKADAVLRAQQEELLERHADGETITAITASMGISNAAPWRWEDADPVAFGSRYARARQHNAHVNASMVVDISDGTDERAADYARSILGAVEGADQKDKEHVARALAMAAINRDRLRMDGRKWHTGKVLPRVYGDRLELSLSDEELDKLTDEQLRDIAAGKAPKGVR